MLLSSVWPNQRSICPISTQVCMNNKAIFRSVTHSRRLTYGRIQNSAMKVAWQAHSFGANHSVPSSHLMDFGILHVPENLGPESFSQGKLVALSPAVDGVLASVALWFFVLTTMHLRGARCSGRTLWGSTDTSMGKGACCCCLQHVDRECHHLGGDLSDTDAPPTQVHITLQLSN
jgi:hypothetical protein